jgi:hypothetical protein
VALQFKKIASMATYRDALLRNVKMEMPVVDQSAVHKIEQVPYLHALAIQKPKGDISSLDFQLAH